MTPNFYPEKPVVPFYIASEALSNIVALLRKVKAEQEVKRAAYVFLRNETGNGAKIINGTNLCGAQADNARWPEKWDSYIVATSMHKESMTRSDRRFLVFDTLETGISFLCDRIQSRGLYVGGRGKLIFKWDITNETALCFAYECEWVRGCMSPVEWPSMRDFVYMYKQAVNLF
jgi:hypothetical protein